MPRLKICVLTPRYSIAGVALAQLRFARALASAGHDVDLIIAHVNYGLTVPDLPGVNMILWDYPQVRSLLLPLRRYLRTARPDVVFAAEDHLTTILLASAVLARSKVKISGSSRVSPITTFSNKPLTKKWFLKQGLERMFWRADALTCVSRDMVDQFRQVFTDPPHVCVYNIVDDASARERLAEPLDEEWLTDKQLPVVMAAGTLTWRKNFALLIDALSILKQRGVIVRAIILGEGHKRRELEQQIADEGLQAQVKLPGAVANPLKYFARADVFVLTSRFEGLPNVLIEAMVAGCTPVATDCPTGPAEVLTDDRFGYLVPTEDPASMADAIERAIQTPATKEALAEAVTPFSEDAVIRRHFEVLGL